MVKLIVDFLENHGSILSYNSVWPVEETLDVKKLWLSYMRFLNLSNVRLWGRAFISRINRSYRWDWYPSSEWKIILNTWIKKKWPLFSNGGVSLSYCIDLGRGKEITDWERGRVCFERKDHRLRKVGEKEGSRMLQMVGFFFRIII